VTAMTTSTQLRQAIAGIADTDVLDLAYDLLDLQRESLTRELNRSVMRGSTVTITGQHLRPKYLIGVEVVVSKVNDKTFSVDFPALPGLGRWSGAKGARLPKTCVSLNPDA
jgi:hypothetical protein